MWKGLKKGGGVFFAFFYWFFPRHCFGGDRWMDVFYLLLAKRFVALLLEEEVFLYFFKKGVLIGFLEGEGIGTIRYCFLLLWYVKYRLI